MNRSIGLIRGSACAAASTASPEGGWSGRPANTSATSGSSRRVRANASSSSGTSLYARSLLKNRNTNRACASPSSRRTSIPVAGAGRRRCTRGGGSSRACAPPRQDARPPLARVVVDDQQVTREPEHPRSHPVAGAAAVVRHHLVDRPHDPVPECPSRQELRAVVQQSDMSARPVRDCRAPTRPCRSAAASGSGGSSAIRDVARSHPTVIGRPMPTGSRVQTARCIAAAGRRLRASQAGRRRSLRRRPAPAAPAARRLGAVQPLR